MEPERAVTIYGAGAVGCYLGGKLAGSRSARITLIGRQRLREAVHGHGLIVREGEHTAVYTVPVETSAAAVPPANLLLLGVRTYDIGAAIPDLTRLLESGGLLVAMQNGVGTEEDLAGLGRDRVLAGTLTVSVGMPEPGEISRYSRGGGIALATMTGAPVPSWVVQTFAATGLPTVTVQDYRSLRWSKLLLNMLGAAQSAILDMDIEPLITDPRLFGVEQLAFREAASVMDALGIPAVALPGYPVPSARLIMRLPRPMAYRLLAGRISRSRGGHSPTMRADMARGKTEVAALNGAVVKAAGGTGVSAPINQALTDLTEFLAAHPERRELFRGNPERLLAYLRGRNNRI